MRGERGQASVELLGAVPALLALALIVMQLLAVGYSKVLAGASAEAGALALAAGGDARAGVREALPGWSRADASVTVGRQHVEVRLRPPSILKAVGRALAVEARAEVRLTGVCRLVVADRTAPRLGGTAGESGVLRLALGDSGSRPGGGVLAAARDWIVESEQPVVAQHARRPVIAVFGLAPRCGTTVVARSLAAALAAADPAGAATVWSADPASGLAVPARSATRLAGRIANVPGAAVRATGRLCIVTGAEPFALADTASYHGPVVLDGGAALAGGAVAAAADLLLLVGIPRLEPALAAVVASRLHTVPLIVLNRAEGGPGRWVNADHPLPESRLAAQLALGGREPRGAFGRAVRSLARGVCDMSPH